MSEFSFFVINLMSLQPQSEPMTKRKAKELSRLRQMQEKIIYTVAQCGEFATYKVIQEKCKINNGMAKKHVLRLVEDGKLVKINHWPAKFVIGRVQ